MVAQANTIAVTNSASATSAGRVSGVGFTATMIADAQSTIEMIPTPEMGLLDAPISPAMYPATAAIRKPPINTNGTAIIVRLNASVVNTVDFANVNASHAAIARQATVSPMIHPGA